MIDLPVGNENTCKLDILRIIPCERAVSVSTAWERFITSCQRKTQDMYIMVMVKKTVLTGSVMKPTLASIEDEFKDGLDNYWTSQYLVFSNHDSF